MQTENVQDLKRSVVTNIYNLVEKYASNNNNYKLEYSNLTMRITLYYLLEKPMYFYFYAAESLEGITFHCKANSNYNQDGEAIINTNAEEMVEMQQVYANMENWLSSIKNEEGIQRIAYRAYNGVDEITEDNKIKSSHKTFSNLELEILFETIQRLQQDLMATQELNFESTQELKQLFEEFLKNAPVQTKDQFQEIMVGKIFKKAVEHTTDTAFKLFLGHTYLELVEIFKGTALNQLSVGMQSLKLNEIL